MNKILVTGGLGFIGSHFIVRALKDGLEVVNLDKKTYAANLDNLKSVENNPNYKLVVGDICDLGFVANLFEREKFDTVVNFAAESHVDKSIENPDLFVTTNVNGVSNLLRVSLDFGIKKYLQVSTDEVYGDLTLSCPKFTEKNHLLPNSPYSASKAAADLLVRSYDKTFGLNTLITRCSNNFGQNQDDTKLIPVIVQKALKNEKIPIYGAGKNIRDWIFVEDHVAGIFATLEKGDFGEVYNFGGNKELTNLDLCKKILKILGKSEDLIEFVEDRKGHDFRYAVDDSKSQKELSWKREGTFDKNLEKTVLFLKNKFESKGK